MLAFVLKWFFLRYIDKHRVSLDRRGNTVDPPDIMIVSRQFLSPRAGVVKYQHTAIANDYQSLFLEGMQP